MILLNPAEDWSKLSTTSHYAFRPCQGHQLYGWKDKGYKTIIDVMTVNCFFIFVIYNIPDYFIMHVELSFIINFQK